MGKYIFSAPSYVGVPLVLRIVTGDTGHHFRNCYDTLHIAFLAVMCGNIVGRRDGT
jgi:hypothetical protein